MSVVSNSSAVSTRKPLSSGKTQTDLKRDRQIIISPGKQTVPASWRSRSVPSWLLPLHLWQRRFGIATYILITGMLAVYGSTVYSQQKWSQEYRKLENLQRDERQLITKNEVLKNHLAKEAEQPVTELVAPNPADAIILHSSSRQSDFLRSKPNTQPKIDIPTGY